MGLQSHGVHLFPGDVVVVGNVLSGLTHGHVAAGIVLKDPGVAVGLIIEGAEALGHALHAAADADLVLAGSDGVGNGGDGLQAGRAETVDGLGGNVIGKLSAVDDQSAGVQVQLVDSHGAAGDHVADLLGMLLDVRDLGNNTLQRLSGVVDGMHVGQAALTGAAARGSTVSNNNRIGHGNLLLNSIGCAAETIARADTVSL